MTAGIVLQSETFLQSYSSIPKFRQEAQERLYSNENIIESLLGNPSDLPKDFIVTTPLYLWCKLTVCTW